MERVVVGIREAGIIAPLRDANVVKEMVTGGLSSCFTFSLHDPDARVGLLTHVDPMAAFTLGRLVRNVSPTLRDLGARNVKVETSNLMESYSKEIVVKKVVNDLKDSGLEIIPSVDSTGKRRDWVDRGRASGAVLDATNGLEPFTWNEREMVLTAYELHVINEMLGWKNFFREALRLTFLPSIKMRYQPTV